MSEMLLTHRGVVYPWQCDQMGHLNVMHYVGKFDEATWQMFAAIGLGQAYLRANNLAIAAVRQEIAYRHELIPGDLVTIRTAILEVNTLRMRFYHEMFKDESGEVAAATAITGVLLDTGTRKPTRLPSFVKESAKNFLVKTPLLV